MTKSKSINALFQPWSIKDLHMKNRTVMAPMTRNFSPEGVPDENVVSYYRRRAESEVGLIVTEGTGISHPASLDNGNIPRFYGEDALNGWKKVVEAVHEAGGKIVPQLWHVGMTRPLDDSSKSVPPVGPSGLNLHGEKVVEPLSDDEIELIIQAYAEAAKAAKDIGFDGIEIHGAHGYLIDQFFWDVTNKRTDQYGGNAVERTRFAAEVIKACRKAVGEDFPIIFRFSQWKMTDFEAKLAQTPDELREFLAPLTEAGVDVYHCSTRRFWEPEFEGSSLNLAGWTKELTGLPVITVGSIGLNDAFTERTHAEMTSIDQLVERLEENEFDLVAIGRPLLSDPAWVQKVKENNAEAIVPFSKEALKELY
ncbi:2,4-dienoyl-CoA reductase-like NADH-dependent reductase (Old Yellow Enzyme family) [Sinobaca qinghaiensis]|uniref:2,4-dienoyl-CoA reductase-like NADH-dependent reductase (Old Yellow Enzyme family) n=1 Tax=Sinobaca qinghaiensis TaxID=342944 RepID=A0A419V469_9BACL|nr:NADH:flavin oxidoreductase [Sinobaca qinghaiensis]RKD73305.1 2,4-dienoyl-CoA reductase-like NADH-dependent reductase (Old Yellow Enzyme family) [Sinobaca qinghaiensis]